MHPVTSSRLAFSLAARTSESSFPERHAEPDDMAHLHDHEQSYDHHQLHPEPGFPKLGLLAPELSAFWHESWHEQYHPPQHDAPARHRPHHEQTHHWVDDAACFSPTSPADVMRIPSPQTNNPHHVFSPLPPSATTDDGHTTPSEWDAILHAADLDFPWQLPAQQQQQQQQQPDGRIKSEDDSESAWSGNDSNSNNSSEVELLTPPPQQQPQQQPQPAPRRRTPAPRRRLGSVPRVTKLSKVPAPAAQGGGVYHTFRMSKRPAAVPSGARPPPVAVDLIESTPFGPHPITNFGAAASDAAGNDPAKMLEKRIAHKLSEKGRRNRLTSAIREIQKLMPLDAVTPPAAEGAPKDGGDAVVYPHFSKVDVVEMAIGYIRRLQKENEEIKRRAAGGEGRGDGGESAGTGA